MFPKLAGTLSEFQMAEDKGKKEGISNNSLRITCEPQIACDQFIQDEKSSRGTLKAIWV